MAKLGWESDEHARIIFGAFAQCFPHIEQKALKNDWVAAEFLKHKNIGNVPEDSPSGEGLAGIRYMYDLASHVCNGKGLRDFFDLYPTIPSVLTRNITEGDPFSKLAVELADDVGKQLIIQCHLERQKPQGYQFDSLDPRATFKTAVQQLQLIDNSIPDKADRYMQIAKQQRGQMGEFKALMC